jgi:hypothetical protein
VRVVARGGDAREAAREVVENIRRLPLTTAAAAAGSSLAVKGAGRSGIGAAKPTIPTTPRRAD